MKLLFSVILASVLLATGCSLLKDSPPSLVVVAIENLPFGALDCVDNTSSDDAEMDGFEKICTEFVRFTHAYTTSTMSQAAMGTLNWQINGSAGQPNFGMENNASVNNGVTTWKAAKGSLYGTASHVELGAELLYSKQDINNYLQAIGTVVLSE